MSPEIIMGEKFDLPTDVYSLGIIFIEILTRIVVGAKVYARQAPVFTPDPDAVRRRASPGCPPDFIDLALQCCSFAPVDRPTLPEILLRLGAIETTITDEAEGDYKRAAQPFRREGKRSMPIFDFSSDDEEAEADIDDQLMPRDDAEEKIVYQALSEVDIVIDGTGPRVDLVSSPAKTLADESADVFYNTDSEIRCECAVHCSMSHTYSLWPTHLRGGGLRRSSQFLGHSGADTLHISGGSKFDENRERGAPESPQTNPFARFASRSERETGSRRTGSRMQRGATANSPPFHRRTQFPSQVHLPWRRNRSSQLKAHPFLM